jgi:hypothetical protein
MISSPLADVSSEAAFTRSSDGLGASASSVKQSDASSQEKLDGQAALSVFNHLGGGAAGGCAGAGVRRR